MKLKFFAFLFLLCFAAVHTAAAAGDAGLRYIAARGKIRCGTNLSSPFYASRNEDGMWKGFDVDVCQAFSLAVFGTPERFEMVDVRADQAGFALSSGQIDIMLGGQNFSAQAASKGKMLPAGILYYDRQVFLGRNTGSANSLEDYKGATVCVVADSNDANNIEEFSSKHKLDLKMLTLLSERRATEAFLLNRCQLLSGNYIYLRSLWEEHFTESQEVKIIPDVLALSPVYLLVAKDNPSLQSLSFWIINALQLAEMYGVNSQNVSAQIGLKNTSQRNLLGKNPKLWNKFGLRPDWVIQAVGKIGNYGEIYERNFGQYSNLKIDRAENRYLKDGGLINPQPFL